MPPSYYPWLNTVHPNPPTHLSPSDSSKIKDTVKPQPEKPYYITIDDDTTKYYNDSAIYLLTKNTQFKLTIHKDSTMLYPSNYKWDANGNIIATGKDSCKYSRNGTNTIVFTVNDGTKDIIRVTVEILPIPYIVFGKKKNFNGNMGGMRIVKLIIC